MVQKTRRLTLLLAAGMTLLSSILDASRFSEVTLDHSDPCSKIASIMQQQADAIGYPAKLACLGDATMRHAGTGLADYMQGALDAANASTPPDWADGAVPTKLEAEAAWIASAPTQHQISFKHGNAATDEFKDIAVSGDGNLIAVAAGAGGLFIYNKNYTLLRHMSLADLQAGGTGAPTGINTVSFHPGRPWLAIGTINATATENLVLLNLEGTDTQAWTAILQTTAGHDDATGGVLSARFSPDGQYLATSDTNAVITVDVDNSGAFPTSVTDWSVSSDFTAPTITATAGHISWRADSTQFALVASATAVAVARKHAGAVNAVGSGATPAVAFTTPLDVSFNHNGKKLAVIEAGELHILDTKDNDPTQWNFFKQNDGTADFTITPASATSLTRVLFHPHVDILVATNGSGGTGDLVAFDVRGPKPQKLIGTTDTNIWVEYTDPPSIFPFTIDVGGTAVVTEGLAWNKFGTQLFVGSQGDATRYPQLVTIDTHNENVFESPSTPLWTEAKRLQYHIANTDVVAASLTGDLLATGQAASAVGDSIIKIWDTSNSTQVLLGEVTAVLATDTVDALAFSPDSKYLFVGGVNTGAANQIRVYDITDPTSPTLAGTAVTVDPNNAINSMGVTKLKVNNGAADALSGRELYFVASGMDSASATTHQVDIRAFDPVAPALSAVNLATALTLPGNGFGEHGPLAAAAAVPLRVAVQGNRLITSNEFDNSGGGGADDPEIKVWNLQNFVNFLITDIDTPPLSSGANPIATLNASDADLTANWPLTTIAITSIDLSSDGNLIAMADASNNVYLNNIITLTDPKPVDRTTVFAATPIVKFAPGSKYTNLTKDGYLAVGLSAQESPAGAPTFTDVDVLVFDLGDTPTTSILQDSALADGVNQAYNMQLNKGGTNGVASIAWGRKGFKLYAGGVDGVTVQHHVNTALAAVAQNVVNNYDSTKGLTEQTVTEEVVKDMFRLMGVDIDSGTTEANDNATIIDSATTAAITYLASNPGDLSGTARAIQRVIEGNLGIAAGDLHIGVATAYTNVDVNQLSLLSLATIAANRYATFQSPADTTPGLFQKDHLMHPTKLAVECDNNVDLSRQYTQTAANKIFRFLRQYQGFDVSGGATNNADLIDNAALAARNKFFTALGGVADSKGVDSAIYAAGLGYPTDRDVINLAKELGVAAHDHVTESLANSLADLQKEASVSTTDALRRFRQQHVDDKLCRAAAQQAENYIGFGKQVMDFMGILPVEKSVAFAATRDLAWSHDDAYLFAAAGTDGLLVFDRDYKFIKKFTIAELGGQSEDGTNAVSVTSVTTHPYNRWLVIGTGDTTGTENVIALDCTSDNPQDWIKTKITQSNLGFATEVLSVRFSPDGRYLVSTTAAAVDAKAVELVDPSDPKKLTFEQWPATTTNFSSLPTMTATSIGHIAWQSDSQAFAVITDSGTGDIAYTTTGGSTTGIPGTTATAPISSATGLAFNASGNKLAITSASGGGADTDKIAIVNPTVSIDPADWNVAIELTATAGVSSGTPRLANPIFHPTKDILVVTDDENRLDTTGGGTPDDNAKDVRVFDLTAVSSAKWFELNSTQHGGKFPFILSETKLTDDNGTADEANFGVAWNKLGTKFAVGNNKLQVTDNKADLVVFATNISSAAKWTFDRATYNYDEAYRVAICSFDAMRKTTGALVVGADGCLNGINPAVAYTPATLETAVDALDKNKTVPFAITKDLRAQIVAAAGGFTDPTTLNGADPLANNGTDVYTAALASALVAQAYAGGTPEAFATMETRAQELLLRETVGTDTPGTNGLLLGSFATLRGDRLNPNFYAAAGTFDESANSFGDSNGPGPDKDGTSGAGEWGSTTSELHGPFVTLGSYLDALYNDVLTPVNGLIANQTAYSSLTTLEKQVVARAILLRTMMSGSETEARELFDGTTDGTFPAKVALLVQEVMRNSFVTYSAPTGTSVPFGALDVSVKQEMAAVALLYGTSTNFLLTTDATNIDEILQNAYDAATYIPEPTSDKARNIAIQKEMALLGGLSRIPFAATSNVTIGKELARGLLSGEQLKGLALEDLGSTGHDAIAVDLSEPLMAAVVGCIVAELGAATNVGSFACGLAYNQLFRLDSVARAVAKVTREHTNDAFGQEIAIRSQVGSEPTIVESASIAAGSFGHSNLSRARYQAARTFERNVDLTTTSTQPATDHAVNAVSHAIADIMVNPSSFTLNVQKLPLFSSATSEPIGTAPFLGHPEEAAADFIGAYSGVGADMAADLAEGIYAALKDESGNHQVDAAGARCDGFTPSC